MLYHPLSYTFNHTPPAHGSDFNFSFHMKPLKLNIFLQAFRKKSGQRTSAIKWTSGGCGLNLDQAHFAWFLISQVQVTQVR